MDEQDRYGMAKSHRKKLQQHAFHLTKNLLVEDDLLSFLVSEGVVSEMSLESINAEKTNTKKVSKLLSYLPRAGPHAFQAFIEALLETQQEHLALMLDEELVLQINSRSPAAALPSLKPVQEQGTPTIGNQPSIPKLPNEVQDGKIQLPDGEFLLPPMKSVNLHDSFFQSILKDPDAYRMQRKPRGRAVIINNEYFVNHLSLRYGTKSDEINLKEMFRKLGFETDRTHNNLAASEIVAALKEESADPYHKDADAFVCIILSHGVQGAIYGADGETVSVNDEIVKWFDGTNCPALKGKPKVFFIQACRSTPSLDHTDGPGGDHTDATPDVGDAARALSQLQLDSDYRHEKGDIIISYSTVTGFESLRHEVDGSCFVRALVTVFSDYACKEHLLDLLIRVRKQVESDLGAASVKQVPQTEETTYKKLFFLPGYNTD